MEEYYYIIEGSYYASGPYDSIADAKRSAEEEDDDADTIKIVQVVAIGEAQKRKTKYTWQ